MRRHFCFEVNNKGELKFDFQFLVYNQLKNEFFNASKDFGYFKYLTLSALKIHDPDDIKYKTRIIPIGSIEYVTEWFDKFYNIDIKPINIPPQLFTPTFLKRRCAEQSVNQLISEPFKGKKFIKSTEKFKAICDLYTHKQILENKNQFTDEHYLVSDVIDILAEYRVFVFNNKIQDIRRYSGNYKTLLCDLDIADIEKMIKELGNTAPIAYTLDVGLKINNDKHKQRELFIIEMHDFFSVGLYGFDSEKIPYMFSQWFYWKLKQEGIKFS